MNTRTRRFYEAALEGRDVWSNATWTTDQGREVRVMAGVAEHGFTQVLTNGGSVAIVAESQITRD